MSEDYGDALRTEKHDAEIEFADEVDSDDEFDYAEFYAWVSRQSWAPESYRNF